MKIALGCSMRYRDKAKEVFAKLEELGVIPLFPNLHHTNDNVDKSKSIEEKRAFATEHYRAIDEADICYWMTYEGRLGTSCTLELGYAIAKNKPIYFSEPTNDDALDCYVKAFIPTNQLEKLLS
jgi:nucleoside 2-deoxyribosyltransferase